MTTTSTPATAHCAGTDALTDEEAVAVLAASGAGSDYSRWYGRKMCSTCHGAVLRTSSGKLRKHVPGSNLSPAELAAGVAVLPAPAADPVQVATERAEAQATWAAKFERAEWVAPYDCSDGTPAGATKLGWVCPSCGKLEVNECLLSMNHGYDPSIPGRQPFAGWGTDCTRMMLLGSQERARQAKEQAGPACEECGHPAGMHTRPELVRDGRTCRAFTCHCGHQPGQPVKAAKKPRAAKTAKVATSAAVAKRADVERQAGKVYASALTAGQRVTLRGRGEVAVLRVETWEPRKVLVTLADAGETQLVMGSWAWVRLAA